MGEDIGARLAAYAKATRLGSQGIEEWTKRLTALIEAQPGVAKPVLVSNVRPVDGGAGSSSGTLLFDAQWNERQAALVLRFVPAKTLFDSYDLEAQVTIQRALDSVGIPVPKQLFTDFDGRYMGVSSYVMQRVEGEAAPISWQTTGVIADATPAMRSSMIEDYLRTLARIHAVDWRGLGLGFLEKRANDNKPIARETHWYWPMLQRNGTPGAVDRFAKAYRWIIDNEPEIARPVLCHGDTNLTNNLFRDGKVVAVIDWEMAFLGTPECDLAYMENMLTPIGQDYMAIDGVPTLDDIQRKYESLSGYRLQNMAYYRVFSTLRTAIIWNIATAQFPPDLQEAFAFANRYIEQKLDSHLAAAGGRSAG